MLLLISLLYIGASIRIFCFVSGAGEIQFRVSERKSNDLTTHHLLFKHGEGYISAPCARLTSGVTCMCALISLLNKHTHNPMAGSRPITNITSFLNGSELSASKPPPLQAPAVGRANSDRQGSWAGWT